MSRCVHCGAELASPRAFYCSDKHRKRVERRRRAKLASDAYPAGARRGRVRLGEPTRRELADGLVGARPR